MGTVTRTLWPSEGLPYSSDQPTYLHVDGAAKPTGSWKFDGTAVNRMDYVFAATAYGSGDLTAKVFWYANSATTGDVRWVASIGARSPGDAVSVEADTIAGTAAGATGTANATAKGEVLTSITVTSLDGLIAGDTVMLKIERDPTHVDDDMLGFANLVRVEVSYSDTP